MNKKEIVPAFIFFSFLLCIFLQDLALQSILGTITKSPVVFVAPLLFLFLVLYNRRLYFNVLTKYYFLYSIVSIAVSVITLLVTLIFVTNGNFYVYTEYMPSKLVRAAFYNITYFFTIYSLFALTRHLTTTTIYRILEFFFYFLVIYGLLQQFFNFRIPFINYTQTGESRISLTTSEPSNAAPMLLTLATTILGLRFYLKKNIYISLLIILLTFIMLVLIGSKGVLLLIPLVLIITIRKSLNFKMIAIAALLIIPLAIVIVQKVVPLLVTDINDFTSFSTRVTTLVAAAKSLFLYPFGEGYGTYLLYYPPMLIPTNNQIIHVIGFPLRSTELIDMVSTGKNLPAKSGIANEIIYNGIFAIIFLILVCRYYTKRVAAITNKTTRLFFSFTGIFLLIIFIFNSALETAYFYLLPVVIMSKFTDNNLLINSL